MTPARPKQCPGFASKPYSPGQNLFTEHHRTPRNPLVAFIDRGSSIWTRQRTLLSGRGGLHVVTLRRRLPVRSNATLVQASQGGTETGQLGRVRTLPSRVPSPPPSLLLVFTAPILLTELAIYLVFFFFFLPLALFCACPARPKHGPTWPGCPTRSPGPRLVSSGRGAFLRFALARRGRRRSLSRISGYYSKTT